MKRGTKTEIMVSKEFHREGIPIYIHPSFLRSRGAGQVDLCRIKKTKKEMCVEIKEVKSSYLIHKRQIKRLKGSCELLSVIFNLNCYLDVAFGGTDCLSSGV